MKSKIFLVMLLSVSMNVFAVENLGEVKISQQSSELKGKPVKSTGECVLFGKVTDVKGKPVIGAIVVNKATKHGVVTDLNGMYKIAVPKDVVLVVGYVGYENATIKSGDNAEQEINVVLKEDDEKKLEKDENKSEAESRMILVDGNIYDKSLNEIPSDKIKSVTVIKNQAALTSYIEKYGDKAKDGVVVIELKD